VLLSHLALMGPFHETSEELFYHRLHSSSSVRTNPDRGERTAWFDPRMAGRIVLPYWREFWEYFKVIVKTGGPLSHRVRCHIHLARWARRYRHLMWMDLRSGLAEYITSRMPWSRKAWRWLRGRPTGQESTANCNR
jgi:hypothetical protein